MPAAIQDNMSSLSMPMPRHATDRRTISRRAALASVTLMLSLKTAQAYTSYAAVPQQRQLKFLQELTDDFCAAQPGALTDEQILSTSQILKGWTAASHRPSTENIAAAESIVKRLVAEGHVTGNPKAVPTTADYNCLLESWARSGTGAFAAERCESILNEMTMRGNPDLGSYKAVLMAWRHSHVRYSAARAQRVLEHMLWSYSSGTNPNVLPDNDCFDIVLQNWSQTPSHRNSLRQDSSTQEEQQQTSQLSAPQHAERLLGIMERCSRAEGQGLISPRTSSFNAVIGAWSRHGESNDWIRCSEILSFMHHLSDVEGNDRVRPDGSTYYIVLSTISRSAQDQDACAPKADAVLQYAEQNLAKGVNKEYWEPDTISYNYGLGTWAKSNAIGSFRHARALLDRQWQMHELLQDRKGDAYDDSCRPDIFGYTSVLSSCASESGTKAQRREAFEVAERTFNELLMIDNQDLKPNHVTYGNMLKACIRLLPFRSRLRHKTARDIFRQAKKSGQVGDMVLNRLREAVTSDEFKDLLEGHSKNSLPTAWTRNVKEKTAYQRKKNNLPKRQRKEV